MLVSLVKFRVEDFHNFKLFLAINLDWQRRRLNSVGNRVGNVWLELRDVEDQVDSGKIWRELEFVGKGTGPTDYLERAEILLRELHGRLSRANVFGRDISIRADKKLRMRDA